MKKAELSINLIVVAAIALIILVLVSFFVLDVGDRLWGQTACEGMGGTCVPSGFSCADYLDGAYTESGERCPAQEHCCIPIGE